MTEKEEMELRIEMANVKKDIEHIKQDSADRLEAIMNRFDRIDRRWGGFVAAVFTVCLTFGGIYLEAYFNKDPLPKSLNVVTDIVQ